MLLLETENYRLHHRHSESNICIVSFSGFGAEEQKNNSFFMDYTSKKLDFEIFGVVAKYNCWYLNEGINNILLEIKKIINPKKTIIFYGISMGGFAALKYSNIIKPKYILSFSPQFSLDFNMRDGNTSFYDQFYKDYMKGMNLNNKDVHGTPYIIYDPDKNNEDGINFNIIKEKIPSVIGIKIFYTGHMIISHIKGTENFLKIVNSLHDPKKLNHTLQNIRRKNKNNIINIVSRSILKYPYIIFKSLINERVLYSRASYSIMNNEIFREKIINSLSKRGKYNEISIIVNKFVLNNGLDYELKSKTDNYLCFYSHKNLFLYYNFDKDLFLSSKENNNFDYIVLYNTEKKEFVFRNLFGEIKINKKIKINKIDNFFCSLMFNDKYGSVQPNGILEWNRTSIQDWEKFLIIPLNLKI